MQLNWTILRAKTGVFLIALPLLVLGNNWPVAQAVTLYWDKDANAANNNTTTGAGLGGTGTWDTSSLNWFNGSADAAWVSGSDAVFWGTLGTATLSSAQTVNSIAFKTSGYDLI